MKYLILIMLAFVKISQAQASPLSDRIEQYEQVIRQSETYGHLIPRFQKAYIKNVSSMGEERAQRKYLQILEKIADYMAEDIQTERLERAGKAALMSWANWLPTLRVEHPDTMSVYAPVKITPQKDYFAK
jgi:hypothetical protein